MAYDGERTFRGYEVADLEPLWDRYLPGIPAEDAEDAEDADTHARTRTHGDSASSTSSASFAHTEGEDEEERAFHPPKTELPVPWA